MKKFGLVLPALLFLLIMLPQSNSAQAQEKSSKDQTVRLFNGINLEGWYTFIKDRGRNQDPKKVFSVKDRMIRISGEEFGCITTEKEFENYHLVVEFSWGEETFDPREDKARDSGILLHSQGMDGATSVTWMNSIECQVIEGGTGDFIVVGDGTEKFSITATVEPEKQDGSYVFKPEGNTVTIKEGRINWYGRDPGWKDVKGFRGANDVEKAAGKWNRLECIAKGSEISVILNGKLVNRATQVHPNKGKIQIQSEGAELFVRKVEVEEVR